MVKKLLAPLAAVLAFIAMLYRGKLIEQEKKAALKAVKREQEKTAKADAYVRQQNEQFMRSAAIRKIHQQEAVDDDASIRTGNRSHFDNDWH